MRHILSKTIIPIFFILMIALSFGGITYGATGIGPDFICSGDNTIEQDVGNLVSLFIFGSPVAGSIIYFFARASKAIGWSSGTLQETGKSALKAGFTAPVIIYGLEWVVGLAFGVDFGCLLPGGA